jgi:hypothetical protein
VVVYENPHFTGYVSMTGVPLTQCRWKRLRKKRICKKILFIYFFENSDVVTSFFFFTTEALHFDKLMRAQGMDVYAIVRSLTW